MYELFPYPFYSFPLIITNGTTERNNYNISHYLRDDQRDAKSETFKYIVLMVLKNPQPLPSIGQEISLQVLTNVGQKSHSNSILYAEKENSRIVLLLIKGLDFWSSHTQSVIAGIIAHYLQ